MVEEEGEAEERVACRGEEDEYVRIIAAVPSTRVARERAEGGGRRGGEKEGLNERGE